MNIEDQAVVLPILVATLIVSEAYAQDYREQRSLQSAPGEFHCVSDGFYADPNNCSVFYRCIELEEISVANSLNPRYTSFKFLCGEGTVFDADSETCVHYEDSLRAGECIQHSPTYQYARIVERSSENADNVNKQPSFSYAATDAIPQIGEHSSSPASNAESCTEDGFFPVQNDCIHFYRCVRSNENAFFKYEFSCGEGTIWDPYNNVCNHRWAVRREDCREENISQETPSQSNPEPTYYTSDKHVETTKEATTTTTTSSSSSSSSSSSTVYENYPNETLPAPNSCSTEGFFANEKDCKKFYRCVEKGNGKYTKYEFECGEGSVWDVAENTCNYPYAIQRSNCGSKNTTAIPEIAETTPEFAATTSSTFASSSSSSSFGPSSQHTSSASFTNSAPQMTTTSQPSANHMPSTTSINNNGNDNNSPDTCSSEGFFPSSTDCNKFYRCVQNEGTGFMKFDFNCGPGTVWDAENNVCNHPWAVKDSKCTTSADKEITTTTESHPSLINTTATANNTTTTSTTTPSSSTMPESSVGPTTTKSTTATYAVNASSTAAATKPVPNNYTKCEKAGYYPNPQHCKKFYRCVDWDGDKGERFSIYHFDCPEGTIFDPSLNICNHEASVYPPRECGLGGDSGTNVTTTAGPFAENTTTTTTTADTITTTEAITTVESTTPVLTTQTSDVTTAESISSESTTLSITSTNGETSNETTTIATTTVSSSSVDAITTITSTIPDLTTTTTTTTQAITTTTTTTVDTEPTATTTSTSTTDSESTTFMTTGTTLLETSTPPPATTTGTTITTTESATTTIMPSEKCPKLKANQIALVCPTAFRTHPKQCNLFYQCTISKTNSIQIITLACVNGTVFNEDKIQCLPPGEANDEKCKQDGSNRNEKSIPDNTIALIVPVKLDKPICPNEGSFPYKDDCRLFYRCKTDDEGKLAGYLYQCPEGFTFWSISKRCEKMNKVPCEKKTFVDSWTSILAPVETKNVGL